MSFCKNLNVSVTWINAVAALGATDQLQLQDLWLQSGWVFYDISQGSEEWKAALTRFIVYTGSGYFSAAFTPLTCAASGNYSARVRLDLAAPRKTPAFFCCLMRLLTGRRVTLTREAVGKWCVISHQEQDSVWLKHALTSRALELLWQRQNEGWLREAFSG